MTDEQMQADVGRRVVELRKARGMSQAEMAKRLGLSQSNVSVREAGRVAWNVTDIVRVAEILECSPAELLPTHEAPRPGIKLTQEELALIYMLRRGETLDAVARLLEIARGR